MIEYVHTTGEGTTFTARTAAVLVCDRVFGSNEGARPLLLAVVAEAGAARPIAANVRVRGELEIGSGRSKPSKYELLKKAGYELAAQHVQGGATTVLQWTLPDVFALDPGVRGGEGDEDGDDENGPTAVKPFVVMPAARDLAREVAALGDDAAEEIVAWLLTRTAALSGDATRVALDRKYDGNYAGESRFDPDHPWHADRHYDRDATLARVRDARAALRQAVAWAPLLAAYVDRRTTSPMLRDLRYQALLLATLVELGAASWATGDWGATWRSGRGALRADGLDSLGYVESPLLCAPGPGVLEEVAVECVRGYEAATRGGRWEHAKIVTASRQEHAERRETARKAAAKGKR